MNSDSVSAGGVYVHTARQQIAASGPGDQAAFVGGFSEDVVWHAGGRTRFSGTYSGREQLRQWFERLLKASDGTLAVAPEDVLADEHHLALFLRVTAARRDKTLNVLVAAAVRIADDGFWQEAWWIPDDQEAWNEFWD